MQKVASEYPKPLKNTKKNYKKNFWECCPAVLRPQAPPPAPVPGATAAAETAGTTLQYNNIITFYRLLLPGIAGNGRTFAEHTP